MLCSNCGNSLAPGARFCNRCGAPVGTGTLNAATSPISMARPTLVTFLSILHFLNAAMMIVFALVAFTSLHDKDPIGLPFGILFFVWGTLSFATALGLWHMRQYGRVLQIIFAAIGLLAIPVGTIIAVLLLIYFNKPGTKVLFSGKRVEELLPEETEALRAANAGGGTSVGIAVAVVGGVLVIVAIIGILAAIAIPNFLTAKERGMQRRTMAEMHRIVTDIEVYRNEHGGKLPDYTTVGSDAWLHPFRYAHDDENYWIVSAGKDGVFEKENAQDYTAGATTGFDADLVIKNGEFLRKPEY